MKLFAGVDGGGSRTRVVVADASGRLLGRGESGLANLHHASEADVCAHLRDALHRALGPAGHQVMDVGSIFFGMAGVTCQATSDKFRRIAFEIGFGEARIGVDHDIRIALAGGLAGRPGIALIVGTGSSCYGRNGAGQTWQTGGWGSLVADEGSGHDLGRQAMVAAVRMADGRIPVTALRDRVFEFLGVKRVSEMLARLYEQGIERNEIAALAPAVVELAEAGDSAALGILAAGAMELAHMVEANHSNLPTGDPPQVVITGGLGTARTLYQTLIRVAIARSIPGMLIPRAEFEPVVGAVLLAMQEAGVEMTPEVLDNLGAREPQPGSLGQ